MGAWSSAGAAHDDPLGSVARHAKRSLGFLDNPELRERAAAHLKAHSLNKKAPRVTASDLQRWCVEHMCKRGGPPSDNQNVVPSLSTCRRWLHSLGFSWTKVRKGMFKDGHGRDDVVQYRALYVAALALVARNEDVELLYDTRDMPMHDGPHSGAQGPGPSPLAGRDGALDDGAAGKVDEEELKRLQALGLLLGWDRRPKILVFHDECSVCVGDRGEFGWFLRNFVGSPKDPRGNVMMSAYVTEARSNWTEDSPFPHLKGKPLSASAAVRFHVVRARGGQREWWNGDLMKKQQAEFLQQVKTMFPGHQIVLVYDNAALHKKMPANFKPLNSWPKNDKKLKEGEPSPRDIRAYSYITKKEFEQKCCYEEDGATYLKGLEKIAKERGLEYAPGENLPVIRKDLMEEPGFLDAQTELQLAAQELGHVVLYLPKFHVELNPIEWIWAFVKNKLRKALPDTKSTKLCKAELEKVLKQVSHDLMRRCGAKSRWYAFMYQHGISDHQDLIEMARVWKRHRQVSARHVAPAPPGIEAAQDPHLWFRGRRYNAHWVDPHAPPSETHPQELDWGE